jgi:hypothetical protein
MLQRNIAGAEASFRTGLALEPENPDPLHELGVVLLHPDKLKKV